MNIKLNISALNKAMLRNSVSCHLLCKDTQMAALAPINTMEV